MHLSKTVAQDAKGLHRPPRVRPGDSSQGDEASEREEDPQEEPAAKGSSSPAQFDFDRLEAEVDERVQYEVKDRLDAIKSQAVYQALLAFQESADHIKENVYDKMESEAKEALRQVPNPAYA